MEVLIEHLEVIDPIADGLAAVDLPVEGRLQRVLVGEAETLHILLLKLLAKLRVGHPVLPAVHLPDPVHTQEDDQRQEQQAEIGRTVLFCQIAPSFPPGQARWEPLILFANENHI